MNVAAGPELCAAVTNAGGLGVIGEDTPLSIILALTGLLRRCWCAYSRLLLWDELCTDLTRESRLHAQGFEVSGMLTLLNIQHSSHRSIDPRN